MSEELNELLDEYEEKFDDLFPLMSVKGMGEREVKSIIETCIKSGRKYKPEKGRVY